MLEVVLSPRFTIPKPLREVSWTEADLRTPQIKTDDATDSICG